MSLAGGLAVGDRVVCRGLVGTVVGGPARKACIRLSVAVRYDDGRILDERVADMELLLEEPDDDQAGNVNDDELARTPQMQDREEYQQPEQDQQKASAMWADPQQPEYTRQPDFDNAGAWDPLRNEASPDDSPASPEDDREPPPQSGGYGPDEAEAALRDKIYANYEDLRAAFRALDQSNNGFVTREDFFQAMGNIFLNNGFTEDDVYEVADRFDLNKDGYISYNEFVAKVEGDDEKLEAAEDEKTPLDDPRVVSTVDLAIQKFRCAVDQRYPTCRKAFLAFDTQRRNALSPQNFTTALINHGIYLTPPELELAWSVFDPQGTGKIQYTDFCAVMTQRVQFGAHLNRSMFC